ncbi:trypsin-like serine peptidase [Kitasatospora sp. HPMI-4]|uniref:trypsin-like serine peptidase n=1 Tax=Kitasatospora sp. HPMI-4 TaxID=3448443 RepID=UPI003F1B7329
MKARWIGCALTSAVIMFGAPVAASAASGPTTSTAPPGPEADRVGALFSGTVAPGNHFCTASVVHSDTGNLLVTAAHCLSSPGSAVFAPGYRNGAAPYGTWRVVKVFETSGWSRSSDPDQDFAFLQVAPDDGGRQIESVVGGLPLGVGESLSETVRLYGYPDRTDLPLLCTNATTAFSAHQRRIVCPSYTGGTSGGPFVSESTGRVVGVIGGYQRGGDTADVSYSAAFDDTIEDLYESAVSSAS